jgi:hypothetical protein
MPIFLRLVEKHKLIWIHKEVFYRFQKFTSLLLVALKGPIRYDLKRISNIADETFPEIGSSPETTSHLRHSFLDLVQK